MFVCTFCCVATPTALIHLSTVDLRIETCTVAAILCR